MDDKSVIVQVNKDSRYWIDQENVMWFGEGWKANAANTNLVYYRPVLETMYYDKYKPFEKSRGIEIALNTLKFTGDFSNSKFQVRDILTFRDVYRDYVGILNHYSQNILLKNIQMHYMHGMGVVSQFSKNIHIDNFRGKPWAESQRTFATFAEFLHFSECYGKITVENSLFSGPMMLILIYTAPILGFWTVRAR